MPDSSLTLVLEEGRARIEVSDAPGSYVTITRTHPSGRVVIVRNMELFPLSGGGFIGWDYEMPIGVPVTYTATSYLDSAGVLPAGTSNDVFLTWQTPNEWLKDPLEPIRNLPIRIVDMSSYHYDTPSGVHTILGRPDPVTVGEVRRAADGQITLLTVTKEERDRLHYITASGHTLLLQSTQESGVGNMYLALLSVTEDRLAPLRDLEDRYWTLQYVEVGPPVGDASAFVTYNDLFNSFPPPDGSYDDVDHAARSYLELIEGLDQTSAPPILVWRGN